MCVLRILGPAEQEAIERVIPTGLARPFRPDVAADPRIAPVHDHHLNADPIDLVAYFRDLEIANGEGGGFQPELFEQFLGSFAEEEARALQQEIRAAWVEHRPVQFALFGPDGTAEVGPRVEPTIASTGPEHVIVIRLNESALWGDLARRR